MASRSFLLPLQAAVAAEVKEAAEAAKAAAEEANRAAEAAKAAEQQARKNRAGRLRKQSRSNGTTHTDASRSSKPSWQLRSRQGEGHGTLSTICVGADFSRAAAYSHEGHGHE